MNSRILECGKRVLAVGMEGSLMDIAEKLDVCGKCEKSESGCYIQKRLCNELVNESNRIKK